MTVVKPLDGGTTVDYTTPQFIPGGHPERAQWGYFYGVMPMIEPPVNLVAAQQSGKMAVANPLTPALPLIILHSNYSPEDFLRPRAQARRGYFYGVMPMTEPPVKRAVSFFDGQNLFYHAKAAFGYSYPNYDPGKLADAVCLARGWANHGVRYYTGIPDAGRDQERYRYWQRRFLGMRRSGITVTARPLRYQIESLTLPDGTRQEKIISRREKGIDLRIGLDVVRMARLDELDVAVIFSQDQDLAEVADEIRYIARSEDRWLKIVSAYPVSPTASATRGINKTDWFRMDRTFYDACLDPLDYRR